MTQCGAYWPKGGNTFTDQCTVHLDEHRDVHSDTHGNVWPAGPKYWATTVEQDVVRITKAHWPPVVRPGDGAHINLALLRKIAEDTASLPEDTVLNIKMDHGHVSQVYVDDRRPV